MRGHTGSSGVQSRRFWYSQQEFVAWVSAHDGWWPRQENPSVWGRFAPQAASGRYTFSHVNQPHRHFAETLVGFTLEQRGYVCWTCTKIFRPPERALGGFRGVHTRLVEALLFSSIGVIPQEQYEQEQCTIRRRLKAIDLVGFHCRRNHWVFAEVKKDRDPLHPGQEEALRFLRRLVPRERADVFVASVQLKPGLLDGRHSKGQTAD
jgi:hypothetical protein